MSDRIAVMHRGKVEQLGSAEELYERPRTRFVADFIGTTNLLGGTVEAVTMPMARLRLASGESCLIDGRGLAPGASVEVSIRPESIVLAPAGDQVPDGAVRARVEQVAYLGSNVQYHVRTAGGQSITAVAPKSGERYVVGTTVDATWAPGAALVLADAAGREEEEGAT